MLMQYEKKWVRCLVYTGMFSNEYIAKVNDYCFFVDKYLVKTDGLPTQLQVLSREENHSIVILPTGEFTSVKNNIVYND